MAPVSILYAVALAVYLYLVVLVLVRNPKSLLNWVCAAFILSFALWSLEDVFHGNPSTPLEQVLLFSDIGNVGRAAFASLFVVFTLVLTRSRRLLRHPAVWLALALPPAVFLWALWTGRFLSENVHYSFGWIVVWPWTAWSYGYYAYYVLYMVFAFLTLLRFRRRAASGTERAQAGLILTTAVLSLALGTITDVVLPGLTSVRFPELAGFFGLLWAVGLYYSVARHRLMSVTPQTAADDILAAMPDSALLVDAEGRLTASNRAFGETFGYSVSEATGMPARMLFVPPEIFDKTLQQVAGKGSLSSVLVEGRSKDGRSLPLSLSVRLMRNRKGESVGTAWVLRDVTEQARAEALLFESEEQYRTFVENFQGVVFRAGLDFTTEFIHGAVKDITGYTAEEIRSGTVRWRDLIHPDDIDGLRPGSARLREVPNCSVTREYRIRRKDGDTCWVRETIWNVGDPSGAPLRLHGVLFDITEHHQAMEGLSNLSQFRESVIDNASVWMTVVDSQMRVLIWNKAAETISGYPRDEVVGTRAVWELLYPDPAYRRRLVDTGRPALEQRGETVDLETPIVCRSGERKVLSLTFRPVVNPDGTVSAIIIMGQDVTERRRAEAALHESEEKHRNLVERANDGIVIVQDGIIRYANPWLARLSGYAPGEIVGSEMSRFIAPSELPRIAERYRRRMAGEPVPSTYETVLLLKNDATLHVELNAGVITFGGRPADLVIVRDISERRLAEERDARHVRQMTFLSRTALELVELTPEDDIYLLVAERLKELAGAQLVFVNAYEPGNRLIRTRAAVGLGSFAERAAALIGRSPVGMTFPLTDEAAATLAAGRLAEIKGGLYALSFGAIPRATCGSIEKLLGVGITYSIGFAWKGDLYGNASIVMRSGDAIAAPAAVETFVRQAAIALQRRATEETLHQSEASFRALAENAHDGILIADAQGIHVYANRRAAAMFGVPSEQIAGTNLRDFVEPADQVALADRLTRRLSGESVPPQYEVNLIRRDGSRLMVEVSGARTIWRGQPASLVITRDISERKQAELGLEESRERYRALFQSSPVSLWEEDFSAVRRRFDELRVAGVTDFGQHLTEYPEEVRRCAALVGILDVNYATVRLYKARDKEELLTNLTNVFDEESYSLFRDELAALARGRTVFEGVGINRTVDGERINVVLRCNVAPGCEETLSRVFVSIVDVTNLKPFEPDEATVPGVKGSGGQAEPRAPGHQNPVY
jgi:PAS domain S-box-containing protein